jgi:hypothetical protein
MSFIRHILRLAFLPCLLSLVTAAGCALPFASAQTVCLGTEPECGDVHTQLCKAEPALPIFIVAHAVLVSGKFLDPTGTPINFDAIKPDHRTIVQIKSPGSGEVLFAVPLRSTIGTRTNLSVDPGSDEGRNV